MSKSYLSPLIVAGLFLLAYAVYKPALNGPFLLDDLTNIPQTKVSELTFESVGQVVTSNESGLFGRPIPVLSFLLNYYYGGENTFSFKVVNLIIHLINAVLLFWLLSFTLSTIPGKPGNSGNYADVKVTALIVVCIWALHPVQLSTVMYVVQRMTQLMTMFTLCALLIYLYGRDYLVRSFSGFLCIASGLAIFGLMAILCKENGVLIIPYIILFEWIVFGFQAGSQPNRKYLILFYMVVVMLPVCMAFAYITTHIDTLVGGYEARNFTMLERLLTEPGVLLLYLKMILLPDISQMSIYHDGYPIAAILDLHAVVAIGVVLLLVFCVFVFSKKAKILSLGIGLYLISHSLESTFIPLEIVFEHRNYLALAGVVLPVVWYGKRVVMIWKTKKTGILILVVGMGFLGFQTHVRAIEWSSEYVHNEIAVEQKPGSLRARGAFAISLSKAGKFEAAIDQLRTGSELDPADSYFPLAILQTRCIAGQFRQSEYNAALNSIATSSVTSHTVTILGDLKQNHQKGICNRPNYNDLDALYAAASDNKKNLLTKATNVILYGNYAGVLYSSNQLDRSLEVLIKASDLNPSHPEILFMTLDLLIQSDKHDDADIVLNQMESLNEKKAGIYSSRINELAMKLHIKRNEYVGSQLDE